MITQLEKGKLPKYLYTDVGSIDLWLYGTEKMCNWYLYFYCVLFCVIYGFLNISCLSIIICVSRYGVNYVLIELLYYILIRIRAT